MLREILWKQRNCLKVYNNNINLPLLCYVDIRKSFRNRVYYNFQRAGDISFINFGIGWKSRQNRKLLVCSVLIYSYRRIDMKILVYMNGNKFFVFWFVTTSSQMKEVWSIYMCRKFVIIDCLWALYIPEVFREHAWFVQTFPI